MIDEHTIADAVKTLLAAAPPGSKVILFGSYARGQAGNQSDLDLLVVEPTISTEFAEMVRLREALRGFPIAIDILVTMPRPLSIGPKPQTPSTSRQPGKAGYMNRSHELAGLLLQKARDDAQAMSRLMGDASSADWIVGFHAQQAVEKAIKAVLSERRVEHPFTHDITRLLELLPGANVPLPPDAAKLATLSPYGATLRYENAQSALAPLDRAWAAECVRRTLAWARDLVE